jgi:hypothetical protein
VDTHFDVPDTNEGHLALPLVLVELRKLGDRPYRGQTMEGLKRQYGAVASMAQRAYMEARAVEMVPRTTAVPLMAAATFADLAVRATSAVLRGDHSHVEALSANLSDIFDGLRELANRHPKPVRVMTSALEAAGTVFAHLDLMGSSAG